MTSLGDCVTVRYIEGFALYGSVGTGAPSPGRSSHQVAHAPGSPPHLD